MKQILLTILVSLSLLNTQAQQHTTVKIGTQEWMTKNLDVVTFQNGDTIPEAKTNEAWEKASKEGKPAWCNQANLSEYGQKYGKLYNWYAVSDVRGLALKGFHVPAKAEWDSLVSYLGGEDIAGKKLKSTEGWLKEGNGTNESGFSGLPGGLRFNNGNFFNVDYYASWWSATRSHTFNTWLVILNYNNDYVDKGSDNRGLGLSVRCLKD